MPPRLSLIVPFYDETAFVCAAMDSILAQGIEGLEVVVVNDNPDRFSEARIRALGVPDQVLIVSHAVNRGLSAARNTGIMASSGAVIGFLDSDDYYVSGGLARQLALAEESHADLTHAMAYLAQGGSPQVQVLARDQVLHAERRTVLGGLVRREEAQFIVSSWSSLYRRDFLDRHGLRFDEEQRKFEDRLFVLGAVTAAERMAFQGEPVRVWRRRAGSISTAATDVSSHRLQVQLLEKCMALMRARTAEGLPSRFLKRELFVAVSRLIWEMDLLDAILRDDDPAYQELARRIPALLGPEGFHNRFFDDPVIQKISRIGLSSRRGVISRSQFFALHAAMRAGDFAAVAQHLPRRELEGWSTAKAPRRVVPIEAKRDGPRLILHLGMHKTGSTFLQRQMQVHADALLQAGILFPKTGLDKGDRGVVRPGGFAGHIGLLAASNQGERGIWTDLAREVRASGAQTVILSCENMLIPFGTDRENRLAALFGQLGLFSTVQAVALVRRPDRGIEAFWRELVGNGRRSGARSVAEFLVDNGPVLTDLPGLFGPFELATGQQVRLADFDALAGGLWPGFLRLCGLAEAQIAMLPEAGDVPHYPTPSAVQIEMARLVNALVAASDLRAEVLQSLFRMPAPPGKDRPFLSPPERLAVIDQFCATSGDWARARGYAPDADGWRADLMAESWEPPRPPDVAELTRLITLRLMAEHPSANPAVSQDDQPVQPRTAPEPALTLRLKPRPWLIWLLQRVAPKKP